MYSKSKRFIASFLAVLMAVCMLPVDMFGAVGVAYAATGDIKATLTVDNETVQGTEIAAGKTASVSLSIEEGTGSEDIYYLIKKSDNGDAYSAIAADTARAKDGEGNFTDGAIKFDAASPITFTEATEFKAFTTKTVTETIDEVETEVIKYDKVATFPYTFETPGPVVPPVDPVAPAAPTADKTSVKAGDTITLSSADATAIYYVTSKDEKYADVSTGAISADDLETVKDNMTAGSSVTVPATVTEADGFKIKAFAEKTENEKSAQSEVVELTFTVTAAKVTLTADMITVGGTLEYDGTNAIATTAITVAVAKDSTTYDKGNDYTYVIKDSSDTEVTSITAAGNYTVVVSVVETGRLAADTAVEKEFTVTAKQTGGNYSEYMLNLSDTGIAAGDNTVTNADGDEKIFKLTGDPKTGQAYGDYTTAWKLNGSGIIDFNVAANTVLEILCGGSTSNAWELGVNGTKVIDKDGNAGTGVTAVKQENAPSGLTIYKISLTLEAAGKCEIKRTGSKELWVYYVNVKEPAAAKTSIDDATVSLSKPAGAAESWDAADSSTWTAAYTGSPIKPEVVVTKTDLSDITFDVTYARGTGTDGTTAPVDTAYVADTTENPFDFTTVGTIFVKVEGKKSYEGSPDPVSYTITKADYPTANKTEETYTADIANADNAVDLKALFEIDADMKVEFSDATLTSTGDTVLASPSGLGIADGKLNFKTVTDMPGSVTNATVEVTGSFENYKDTTFTVTISLASKTALTIEGAAVTGTGKKYDGTPVESDLAQIKFKDGNTEITDTDTIAAIKADLDVKFAVKGTDNAIGELTDQAPKNAGSYVMIVSVKGTNASYTGSQTVDFTIAKADLTIKPKDSTWDKTLNSANPPAKKEAADVTTADYECTGLVAPDTAATIITTQPSIDYYTHGNTHDATTVMTPDKWSALSKDMVADIVAADAAVAADGNYVLGYEAGTCTVVERTMATITTVIPTSGAKLTAADITAPPVNTNTEIKNFTILADNDHTVDVNNTSGSAAIAGYTSRIDTKGTGNQFYRSIAFKTTGAAILTIKATSNAGGESRKIALVKANADNTAVAECDGYAITNESWNYTNNADASNGNETRQTGTTYTAANKLYVNGSTNELLNNKGNHWNLITVKLPEGGVYYLYSAENAVRLYEVSVAYDNSNPTPVEISGTVDTANLPAGATIVFVPAATATGATEATYDMESNKVSLLPNVVYTPEVRVGGTKDEDITVKVGGETTYSFNTAPTDPIAITFVAIPKYDITVPAVADLENVANIVTGSKGNAKAGETVKISDVITSVTPAEGYKQNGWEVKKTAGTGEAAKVELTNDPTNGWQFVMPGEAVTITPVVVSEDTVLAPTATPGTKDSSVAVASGTKVVLSAEEGNKIYYTTGADAASTLDPKTATDRKDYDEVKAAGGIEITEAITIKAVALKGEDNYSEVVTYSYTITTAPSQVHELTKVEISGKAEVAQTLTAGLTFNPASDEVPTGTTVAYQWYRIENGTETAIAGATSKTYTIMAIDKDKTIKVVVTYTDENGTVSTVSSAPTAVVTGSQGGSSDVPETGLAIKFDDGKTYIYTGTKITPSITVYNNGTPLVEGTDYTVKYTNNVNASHKVENDALTATQTNEKKLPTVTVTGKGSLSKKVTAYFNIVPKALDNEDYALAANADTVAKVSAGASAVASKKATPVLLYGGSKLAVKKNFVYDDTTQQNRTDWDGEAKLKLNGVSNFTGSVELTVNVITKADQANAKIKADFKGGKDAVKNLYYNGTPYVIGFDVSTKGGLSNAEDAEDALTEGTDYIISYPEDLTNVGSKKVTITGISSRCTGSVTKTYKVIAANKNGGVFKVDGVDTVNGYDYVSTGVTFDLTGDNAVTVKYVANSSDSTDEKAVSADGESLVPGEDFKITYSNNKKVGTAKYTVTGLGNYKGVVLKNQEFTINPVKLIDGTNTGIDVTVADVFYNKSAAYKSVPYVTVNGKLLKASEYVAYYKVAGESETEVKGKTRKIADADFAEGAASITVTVRIEAKGKNVIAPAEGENALTKDFKIIKKDAYAKDKDLSKAKITFYGGDTKNKVGFTGNAVYPTKMDIKVGSATASVELDETGQPKDKTTHKYTIVYADNIAKGKATAVVMADDDSDYVGGKAGTFSIVPKALDSLDTEHGEGFITSFMKGLLGK